MLETESFNPCAQSGCKGYCCYDINIEVTISERRRLWPNASRVNTVKKVEYAPGFTDWVYYTRVRKIHLTLPNKKHNGFVLVGIVGKCPNLDAETGACLMHQEREHAARNYKIGDEDCTQIRRKHSLPDLPFPEQPE